MIAGFYVSDIGADLLDDAGRFVPEHRGQRMWIETVHEMQVGVTQPGDGGADQYLARTGFRQADVLDHQRLVDFMQDGGLHRCSPFCVYTFYIVGRALASSRERLGMRGSGLSLGRHPSPGSQMRSDLSPPE